MRYDYTNEQKLLKDSARNFFKKELGNNPSEISADLDKKLWKKMAELGWMGVLIPEENGGEAMGFMDLSVILYEMGYAGFATPYLATAFLCVDLLNDFGTKDQKKALLPMIADGRMVVANGLAEMDSEFGFLSVETTAAKKDGRQVLNGAKYFVGYAEDADLIITLAKTGMSVDDLTVLLVRKDAPGVRIKALAAMGIEKQFQVTFSDVDISPDNVIGEMHQGRKVLEQVLLKAAVAKSAEMCGGSERAMEIAVEYAKKREQFGKPIGSFQAIQHHCANMLTYFETSQWVMLDAAWRISEKIPYEEEAFMCKACVSKNYRDLAAISHQVMGGYGFMEETGLCRFFEHAKASESLFGDTDYHLSRLADRMGI
jgi:alkylation response protein AidB-like acyl-CoA dehydrogenase